MVAFGKGEEESVGANRRHVADFEVFAELVERRAPPPALARVLQPAGRAAAGAAEAAILAGEESIAETASETARRPARASE